MKVKAQLNNVRISPQKVRLVARELRGRSVDQAAAALDYELRRSGAILAKLIRSAEANAVNNFQCKKADLIVDEILIGAGPTLKRWRPRAYGRASKILKRTARITVILSDETPEDKKEKSAKVVKKTTPKKAATKKAATAKKEKPAATKKTATKKKAGAATK